MSDQESEVLRLATIRLNAEPLEPRSHALEASLRLAIRETARICEDMADCHEAETIRTAFPGAFKREGR